MRRASLDVGSQSILLLVAEQSKDELTPLIEKFYSPRLGEDLARTGRLSEAAMDRAESALGSALELCRQYDVEEIVAGGTAALREAVNGQDFVAGIKENLGLDIRIISSEKEAELTFVGATSDLNTSGKLAVLDVGGASTECTVGEAGAPELSYSVPMGAVRLRESYGRSPGQMREAMAEVMRRLAPLVSLAEDCRLVGVGGTITTLAAVHLKMKEYDADKISGMNLSYNDLENQITRFCNLELEEIKKLPGMEASRADIIEAGATIIQYFMAATGQIHIRVSARGLRYGLLLDPDVSSGE